MKQVALLLLSAVLLSSSLSYAGGQEGGGGDAYVLEFVAVGRKVTQWLRQNQSRLPESLNLVTFKNTLEKATIESTEETLTVGGVVKDAKNFPEEQKIIINRLRWASIAYDDQKWRLVTHEILSLMRYPEEAAVLEVLDRGASRASRLHKILVSSSQAPNPVFPLSEEEMKGLQEAAKASFEKSSATKLGKSLSWNCVLEFSSTVSQHLKCQYEFEFLSSEKGFEYLDAYYGYNKGQGAKLLSLREHWEAE